MVSDTEPVLVPQQSIAFASQQRGNGKVHEVTRLDLRCPGVIQGDCQAAVLVELTPIRPRDVAEVGNLFGCRLAFAVDGRQ